MIDKVEQVHKTCRQNEIRNILHASVVGCMNTDYLTISGQCSHSIPVENTRKRLVFRCFQEVLNGHWSKIAAFHTRETGN